MGSMPEVRPGRVAIARRVTRLIALTSLVALSACTGSASTAPPAASTVAAAPTGPAAIAQPAALLATVMGKALRAGSDAREHVEYNLVLTNVFTAPVT